MSKTPRGVPEDADYFVEYQINHEEIVEMHTGEMVRDNIDCDFRETLKEARNHFFLDEEHWSIEKLERWGVNGDEVHREYTLIEESEWEGDEK